MRLAWSYYPRFAVVKDKDMIPSKDLKVVRSTYAPHMRFIQYTGRQMGFTTLILMVCDGTATIAGHEVTGWAANHAKNATAAWNMPIPSTRIMG